MLWPELEIGTLRESQANALLLERRAALLAHDRHAAGMFGIVLHHQQAAIVRAMLIVAAEIVDASGAGKLAQLLDRIVDLGRGRRGSEFAQHANDDERRIPRKRVRYGRLRDAI